MPLKTRILFLFLPVFFNASAQRDGFALEPYMGYSTSASVQNGSNKSGERFGCGLAYMLNDHFGVSSGLQIQRYATEVISGQDSAYFRENPATASYWEYNSVNANYNFTYLELPVTIRYISSQDQKTGVFAEAGFTLGYLIADRESGIINVIDIDTSLGGSETTSKLSLGNIAPKTTAFNFSGHLALGEVNPISTTCSLVVELSINKGVTNVGNSSNDFVNAPLSAPFYYYNRNANFSVPEVSNYGTDFSVVLSVRLIIKLDNNSTTPQINK